MLLDAELDNRFWGEAILTAAYLQNRMTSRSVDKTSIELFTGEKPDVGHIRVFGSKAYSLIPKQRRRKWDDKAEEGVLVRYDGNTKGYRILDPSTNRIWINRSVRIIGRNSDHLNLHRTSLKKQAHTSEAEYIEYELLEETHEISINSEEESNTSEEEFDTPLNSPEEPERHVSQRGNKGVPPSKLVYRAQLDAFKEPISWT
ncbi:Copia protein [Trachymyrmex zeteki]|uniref:Copia protein n=1 Tax=Mycetomoellerius zeteki TaxID=64791 RepID=A0A151WZA9_9HYME|nr:Copia protein [Trachymyrmex zeteki]